MKYHLEREWRTIQAMALLFCRGQGHSQTTTGDLSPVPLCSECRELLAYARERLDRCPFLASGKPRCTGCRIHCYTPDMRLRVSRLMRYAGPRMLRRHPLLALAHLLSRRRPRR